MCAERVQVFDGDVGMVVLKSRFISRKLLPRFEGYKKALNALKARKTEVYVLHRQRICASREFRSSKKTVEQHCAYLKLEKQKEELVA